MEIDYLIDSGFLTVSIITPLPLENYESDLSNMKPPFRSIRKVIVLVPSTKRCGNQLTSYIGTGESHFTRG